MSNVIMPSAVVLNVLTLFVHVLHSDLKFEICDLFKEISMIQVLQLTVQFHFKSPLSSNLIRYFFINENRQCPVWLLLSWGLYHKTFYVCNLRIFVIS
jgi:hypothetical protein